MRNRITCLVFLLSVSFLTVACDSNSSEEGSPPASVEGEWQSDRVDSPEEDFTTSLTLTQNGVDISGSSEIQFLENGMTTERRSLSGTYEPPDLSLQISGSNLDCLVESNSRMECVDAETFSQTLRFVLTRQ